MNTSRDCNLGDGRLLYDCNTSLPSADRVMFGAWTAGRDLIDLHRGEDHWS